MSIQAVLKFKPHHIDHPDGDMGLRLRKTEREAAGRGGKCL
jgi:hypothetical protein